ncbi:MAG: hypothetical protein K6G38_01185 [Gammaproteobacteria bacterium]|nr:hypothetical protein [Gammaproteobacteria bacterium]
MKKFRSLLLVFLLALTSLALVSCGKAKYSEEVNADPQIAAGKISGYCVTGAALLIGEGDSAKAVGSWGYGENSVMSAVSVKAVSEYSKEIADAINGKAAFVYQIQHVQIGTEAVKAGWTTKVVNPDGTVSIKDGGYAVKCISYVYNEVLDTYTVPGDSSWIPSKVNYVNNLTPSLLYMVPKTETKDAAGNDWASNSAVYKGGLYTVVVGKYTEAQDGYGWFMGLYLENELTSYELESTALEKLSLVGKINGVDDWNKGVDLTLADGKYTVALALAAGDEIKVRANDAWTFSWGYSALTSGSENFEESGGNIKIKTAGTYDITIAVPTSLIPGADSPSVFTVVAR